MVVLRSILLLIVAVYSTTASFRNPDWDDRITFRDIEKTDQRSEPSVEELVLQSLDPSTDRCEDFFQYACGGQLAKNKTGLIYSASLTLYKTVLPLVKANPVTQGFFQSCQNLLTAEPTVSVRLKNSIAKIEAAEDVSSIMAILGTTGRLTPVNVFLHSLQLFPRLRDGSNNGALYFDFGIEGDANSFQLAMDIIKNDNLLSKDQLQSVQEVVKNLPTIKHKTSISDFDKLEEDIDESGATLTIAELVERYPVVVGPMLKSFFAGRDLEEVIVDPRIEEYSIAQIEKYLSTAKLPLIVNVVKYSIARSVAALYPNFRAKDPSTVSMTCLRKTMEVLSDVVGKDYMELTLSTQTAKATKTMIDNIIKEARILLNDKTSFLDEATRKDFGEKINSVQVHIGGQKNVGDYTKRDFAGNTYLTNLLEIARVNNQKLVEAVGRKIDPFDIIEAAQVNAFYHPLYNDLFIPAGILQRPMFGNEYPLAIQHSVIGYVLAHELSHSIDPKCIRVNKYGESRNVWYTSPEAKATLESSIKCYVDSYSKFQVIGSKGQVIGNVNGQKTVGENVADSGLQLAYSAFMKTGDQETFGDFSVEQLFFLTSAQVWCNAVSDADAARLLITDVHSPAKARVNGVLMHNDAFAKAFKCPAGSAMNPEAKCNWWGKP